MDRRELWRPFLSNVNPATPSILASDFNCVLNPLERVGGCIPLEREYREFTDVCTYLKFEDAPSSGCSFTWTDGTKSSKIDRVMINTAWLSSNLSCRAVFLPKGTVTDHTPVVTTLFQDPGRFSKLFKFFYFWMKNP